MGMASSLATRVPGGVVLAAVGFCLLVWSGRVSAALVAGQRATIRGLFGDRLAREPDRLQGSAAFGLAARLFVAAIGLLFLGGGIAIAAGA